MTGQTNHFSGDERTLFDVITLESDFLILERHFPVSESINWFIDATQKFNHTKPITQHYLLMLTDILQSPVLDQPENQSSNVSTPNSNKNIPKTIPNALN